MQNKNRRYLYLDTNPYGFSVEKNIAFVVENNLCTMCGNCEAVCPQDAIKIEYFDNCGLLLPKIDNGKCNDCEICVTNCPGFETDFEYLASIPEENYIYHKYIGKYINIYRTYSLDPEVRRRGTSGGVITQILIYLLTNKFVDAAIITKMNPDNPLEPYTFFATTVEDIIQAQKSKYCPVALNSILKKVLNEEVSYKSIAYVGAPSHVQGLRLLQKHFPILNEKIKIVISFFTSHQPSRHASEFLMYIHKINVDKLKEIIYRGDEHPGKMKFVFKNGQEKEIDHLDWSYWGHTFLFFFYPIREWFHFDKTSILADISVGDNWQKYGTDFKGNATVIARNNWADKIINQMYENNLLSLNLMTIDELIKDQDLSKTTNVGIRLKIWRYFNGSIPIYYCKLQINNKHIFKTTRFAFYVWLTSKKRSFLLLKYIIYCDYLRRKMKRSIDRIVLLPKRVLRKIKKVF